MNSFLVFKDLAKARNHMATFYRCNHGKDEEFHKAMLRINKHMVRSLCVNLFNVVCVCVCVCVCVLCRYLTAIDVVRHMLIRKELIGIWHIM